MGMEVGRERGGVEGEGGKEKNPFIFSHWLVGLVLLYTEEYECSWVKEVRGGGEEKSPHFTPCLVSWAYDKVSVGVIICQPQGVENEVT